MTDNNFDKILKEQLESYLEPVDSDVWAGIESSLNKRARRLMVRKVSLYSTAAAACLLAGIFLFRGMDEGSTIVPVTTTAQVDPVAAPEVDDPSIIEPMTEQLLALANKPATEPAVEPAVEAEATQEAEETKATETTETTETAPEQKVEDAKEETVPMTEQIKAFEDAVAQTLPLGYWEDEEDLVKSKRNTSLSILSNVTSVASPSSFIVDLGPAHASSQSGSTAGNSNVLPVSDSPKFFMPISLGVQFKTKLTDHLYVGAGLNYSYLVTQYDAMVNFELFKGTSNQLHYVGIPVTLYYQFVNTKSLGVYASLGGVVDKCITSRYVYGSNVSYEKVSGMQYSANVGLGVEYAITDRLGIYLDPSIAYFFDNKQPLSIRTAQPLQLKLELGFRFKI